MKQTGEALLRILFYEGEIGVVPLSAFRIQEKCDRSMSFFQKKYKIITYPIICTQNPYYKRVLFYRIFKKISKWIKEIESFFESKKSQKKSEKNLYI